MRGNPNYEAIMAETSWTVIEFNLGAHLRINGVVDVWPKRRLWKATKWFQPAKQYKDIDHLRRIVAAETPTTAAVQQKLAEFEDKAKPPVRQITLEEWKRKFS
jgi:uncharacterized protein (DUF608 family)